MKIPLLFLLLTALARAEPFLEALPQLRQILYTDRVAFQKAFQPWEDKLPDWSPGPARAACFELRASFCRLLADREGEIANLVAAVAEPGLELRWKFRTRLDLAQAHLWRKDQPAYQKVLLEAVREGPAVLHPGELELLLSLKNDEASQRGDLAFNFIYQQMSAQQQPGAYAKIRMAEWYREAGRPEAQMEWWLAARDTLQNDPRQSQDYRQWGALWRAAPLVHRAETMAQQLFLLQSLSPLEQARARVSIASAMQWQQGDRADIEAVLQPALGQLQETPDSSPRIYEDLARLCDKQPDLAATYLRQALELARKDPGQKLGHLYFSLACELEDGGHLEQSLATFQDGLVHVLKHEPEEVPRFFSRSVSAASRLGREDRLSELRALILEHLARLPRNSQGLALDALLDSYSSQQTEQRTQVLIRMRTFYQRSLQECRHSQSWEEYAQAGRGLATVLGRLGDRRAQRQVLEEVLDQTLPQVMREIVEEELLQLQLYSGDTTSAGALAEKLRAAPDPRRRRKGLESLVWLRVRQRQWQAALQFIGELPEKELSSDLFFQRYFCLKQLSRWSEASQALEAWELAFPPPPDRRAQSCFDRAELAEGAGRTEEARVFTEQGFAALLKHPQPHLAASFVVKRIARKSDYRQPLQQLLDGMSPTQKSDLLARTALALARAGRKKEGRQLLLSAGVTDPKLALVYPEFGGHTPAKEPLGAVLDRLRLARPDLESSIPLRSTNLAQIQGHLHKDQCLLAYLPADQEILQVTLTRHSQDYQKLPISPSFLETQIEQDWQALARHQSVHLEDWKRRLQPPAQPRRLLIAPTGPLWKLPFPALVGPDQSVSLLSPTDFSRLADGPSAPFRGGPALAIGAPPAAQLPGAEAELKKLAQLWKNCSLKIGARATPTALLSQPKPLALLHIATHTLARPEDPLQSSVQLHDGNLLLTQLHQLKLRKDALVVLSSCRGALPLNPGQNQPISLASALSAAGAQTVIANLWDADDQAAMLFFDNFYRRLARHHQVGRAFHEAQQALSKAHPDPYYWAGFCLLGNPPS